ncbi:hypothetical protein BGZ88_007726 [Linnemannia elongata]|nr:hypothetical protein BGZ88_007726 [Linnemannia elongata]
MDVDIELHEPYQDDRDTTDEEAIVSTKTPPQSPVPNVVFNLDQHDDAKMEFPVHVDEIYDIGAALRLPQVMILDDNSRF